MLSRNTTILLAALAITGLTLTGCGRKGDLDRPGSSAPINTKAAPGSPEKQDEAQGKPFLLDPLL
ncbi:LPS translocon maturation chaperone LptM [Pararhizobium sp. DWP3-4]|uniref:LPS translocon maturation chaperone LptM n=1 Tax=unclassified Pararhizobium TaxID=2643050 RepID=UPI003CF6885A